MKLAFITHPIDNEGPIKTCAISLVKDIKVHEGQSVCMQWQSTKGKPWEPTGFSVLADNHSDIKPAANLLASVDKLFIELKLYDCSPEELMHKMEKAGSEQVVIHGGEQISVEDVSKVKAQYHPDGLPDVLVNAVDEADAKSTIKGRLIKLLSAEPKRGVEIGAWFAGGEQVVKSASTDEILVVYQRDYHLK